MINLSRAIYWSSPFDFKGVAAEEGAFLKGFIQEWGGGSLSKNPKIQWGLDRKKGYYLKYYDVHGFDSKSSYIRNSNNEIWLSCSYAKGLIYDQRCITWLYRREGHIQWKWRKKLKYSLKDSKLSIIAKKIVIEETLLKAVSCSFLNARLAVLRKQRLNNSNHYPCTTYTCTHF